MDRRRADSRSPDFLIRQFLLDAFIDRHLVGLRREPGGLHEAGEFFLKSLHLGGVFWVIDQIVKFLGVELNVVELGLVTVRAAVAMRIMDIFPLTLSRIHSVEILSAKAQRRKGAKAQRRKGAKKQRRKEAKTQGF